MKVGGRYLIVALGISPVDTTRVPTVKMSFEESNFLVHKGNEGREGHEEYPPMVANIENWLYEEGVGLQLLATPALSYLIWFLTVVDRSRVLDMCFHSFFIVSLFFIAFSSFFIVFSKNWISKNWTSIDIH